MKYKIAIYTSDEGYSVSVPGLPGCWSRGDTEAEALDNIKDAIREYLAVVNDDLKDADIREVDVGESCGCAESRVRTAEPLSRSIAYSTETNSLKAVNSPRAVKTDGTTWRYFLTSGPPNRRVRDRLRATVASSATRLA